MSRPLPDPKALYPVALPDGTPHKGTVFLAEAVKDHPKITCGAFTYASDFDPPDRPDEWAGRLAPYLFPFSRERLEIGKFCQIAHGVRFITSSANHAMTGTSTFPFPIFDVEARAGYQPDTRHTVVGNDVWIGYGATILPGAQIGHGAIIGAQAVVRGTVPNYAIVTGNPGTATRMRFTPEEIAELLRIAWWDWPADAIAAARTALDAHDLEALRRARPD